MQAVARRRALWWRRRGRCRRQRDRTLPAATGRRRPPLRRAILYGVDVRSGEEIAELDAVGGRRGNPALSADGPTSQAIGPKIRWLRKREPDVWRRTRRLTTA